MKLWPAKCDQCDADIVKTSAVIPQRKDRMVFHYRKRDGARWWHWSKTKVVRI